MRQKTKLLRLGAAAATADRQQLIDTVLSVLGRTGEPERELTR